MPPSSGYGGLLRRYLVPQGWAVVVMGGLLLLGIALALAQPRIAALFIQRVGEAVPQSDLVRIALVFLLVGLAVQVARALATYWSQRVGWTATNNLRGDLMAHVLDLDLDFHETRSSGELIERVDGDVKEINEFFSSFIALLAGNVLLLLGILVMLATVDWRIGLAFGIAVVLGLAGLGVAGLLGSRSWQQERQENALFYGALSEILRATEDLRSSGAERYALARFLGRLRGWLPVTMRATAWGSAVWVGSTAVFIVLSALAYLMGGRFYLAGELRLDQVYVVVAYALMLVEPMEVIKDRLAYLQQATAAVSRVRDLLGERSRLADGAAELPDGALAVEFDHVSFRYRGGVPAARTTADSPDSSPGVAPDQVDGGRADRPTALCDLSFRLAPGRVLALVGRTGAGKTTIGRLLFRFNDAESGRVLVGGADVRSLRLAALRQRIGLVTQHVHIFDATVRDNLTFFDATVPDGRLLEVLETLGRSDWLTRLPDGLDSRISAGTLSAGEAQLVAFARVFLSEPGLVILDEASSRVDPATERMLDRAMSALLAGRTAIVIAHRLETLHRADDVLVIEDGRVAEHGAAEELRVDPTSRFSQLHRAGVLA